MVTHSSLTSSGGNYYVALSEYVGSKEVALEGWTFNKFDFQEEGASSPPDDESYS